MVGRLAKSMTLYIKIDWVVYDVVLSNGWKREQYKSRFSVIKGGAEN